MLILALASVQILAQADPKGAAKEPARKPEVSPTPLTGAALEGAKVVEASILVYSQFRGRLGMDQIRKTSVEYGSLEVTDMAGKVTKSEYEKRILRGENLESAKVRLDQRLPNARFALIYDGQKVFGVFDNTVFEPRADASTSFSNRIWHGIDALLRYRESGANVELDRDEKVMGVDYSVLNLESKNGIKTTFYVSKKTFRVMMLEYEDGGVKFKRKFYDYNYAQNTLFPYRTVLWANGKMIEEQDTSTITFGQEFGQDFFSFG